MKYKTRLKIKRGKVVYQVYKQLKLLPFLVRIYAEHTTPTSAEVCANNLNLIAKYKE